MTYDKWKNILYGTIPLGLAVSKTIGGIRDNKYIRKHPPTGTCGRRKSGGITYRVRAGNGKYGSELHKKYQDKYANVLPNNANNPQGQHARDLFKIAVTNWQSFSEAQKEVWNKKVKNIKGQTGYAYYLGYYISQHY